MSESTIKTKYGNAKLNSSGYYQITSRKEGNHNKMLHRVIFEKFYNIDLKKEFPDGIHIHHIDGNKTNNEIWNLEPIDESRHSSLHNRKENNPQWNKPRSEEIKQKISDTMKKIPRTMEHNKKIGRNRNTTGFFRVSKLNNKKYSQGFIWYYSYYPKGKKRQKMITSLNLVKLKEKILNKGLEWDVINLENAKKTAREYNYKLEELI